MQKKRIGIRNRKGIVFGAKEKKRLIQLGLCIFLFMILFLGRGSEVIAKGEAGEKLLQIIRADTDFVNTFSALGESVSGGDSVLSAFAAFGKSLFGAEVKGDSAKEQIMLYEGPAFLNSLQRISEKTTKESMFSLLGREIPAKDPPKDGFSSEEEAPEHADKTQTSGQEASTEEPKQPDVPNVPTYDGPALPANATMEYYSLGTGTTITPVLGKISSAFGYRIHPLTGEHTFHAGVDIAADTGTPIAAFADGFVEFIGESDAYGRYVQLDHGNGIKTFYCHCSELLLGKGKPVTAGQTVALVGDTGDATGSHLHLEIKRDGVLLNPLYYIDTAK